jgi:hypothetical protein
MKQTLTLSVMNRIAESYVKLVLAVGTHDADYVDAYYGPEEWKKEAATTAQPLDAIKKRAVAALAQVKTLATARMEEMLRLRHQYLARQLESLIARVDILSGRKMTFDEESRALYDAVAPTHEEEYFKEFLQELGALLPGSGSVSDRYEKYKKDFVVPKEKLDSVFMAATAESRRRTQQHIVLPPAESFTIEYVTGKSWSGYNWYKGGATSVIQINTDLPIFIDRAVDLSSHEGYPGHHVYNSLLEQRLVIERKWVEFSVYALYSPQSLVAEGTANYGIDMAFPQDERVKFEREVLFPAAGLDPSKAEQYYRVHAVSQKLSYAGNEAARKYLNGEITREDAARWLTEYALMERERAQQRTRFFDEYRSYVINYNLGKDIVRKYIESRPGVKTSDEKRWKEFEQLLSSPRIPSAFRDQAPATPRYQNE